MSVFFRLQDKKVKDKQILHWKNVINLQEKIKTTLGQIVDLKTQIKSLSQEIADLKENVDVKSSKDVNELFNMKAKTHNVANLFKQLDELNKQLEDMENKMVEMEASPPRYTLLLLLLLLFVVTLGACCSLYSSCINLIYIYLSFLFKTYDHYFCMFLIKIAPFKKPIFHVGTFLIPNPLLF